MARSRTRKQGSARAFGKYRYGMRGMNAEDQARQVEIARLNRELGAQGLERCIYCDKGHAPDAETCPHCGEETNPFA